MMHKQYIELNPNAIAVRKRPRDDDGDIRDLVNSIRKIGLLHPVLVDADNVLIAGGRRLAACREAGLGSIPVFRLDTRAEPMLALDVQADENLCRKALTPEELDGQIALKKAALRAGGSTSGGLVAALKRLVGRE
jgi:ParB family transcriptional regulator, chromosome partitioning protein